MFFSISKNLDNRFPNNHQLGQLWFNCDNGWQKISNGFYKGYNDNYCKILLDQNVVSIDHNTPRSFPLWHQPGIVTNIDSNLTPIWADKKISIDSSGAVRTTILEIDLNVPAEVLSLEQAKKLIRQRLDEKLKKVPDQVKLFCSGGLDTLLLYAMLSNNHSFDLITNDYFEEDNFTKQNQTALNKFWAYKQIHHWKDPTWLATGSHGDEYFLRGPAHIAMLTAWHDINFGELLSDNINCYHYHHFNKYSELWKNAWNNRNQLREEYPTIESLQRQILNMLANDHQHWHLGNTLTWTPYMDIEIPRLLLQLNINDLIPQFLDGRLSKDLIIDYNPTIIDYLSQYKNYNPRENLAKLYKNHRKITS